MSTRYISGELYHHGILGQKWGVRRYQNKDGTLTAEGKIRYGSDSEQKKLSDMLTDKRNWTDNETRRSSNQFRIAQTPQVQHAATEVSKLAKAQTDAEDKYWNEVENMFYKNKDLYEEYVNKAVDNAMSKPYMEGRSREDIYKWIKYDDGAQGDHDPLQMFQESGDPRGRYLNDLENKSNELSQRLNSASRKYAEEFLGAYGDKKVHLLGYTYPTSVTNRLEMIINQEAKRKGSFSNKMMYSNIF